MLVDCHVHLDDPKLSDFVRSFQQCPKDTQFRLITNSVDLNSSKRNLEMAGCNSNVTAFVGIHPEVFAKTDLQKFSKEQLNKDFEQISSIAPKSSGIGEIGLDPKYGQESIQDLLFKRQLELAERLDKPVSLHSRESVTKILEILSTFSLSKGVLFHWFAGTDANLKIILDRGYFTSFGPSILGSKKRARQVELAGPDLVLAETDSPLHFGSFFKTSPITPFEISSIIFSMALIRKTGFLSMVSVIGKNLNRFLN